MKKSRMTFAHCHWCNAEDRRLPEISYSKGRVVYFCSRTCFSSYARANFSSPPINDGDVVLRLSSRLEELKSEVIFSPPTQASQVKEEIIYDLIFILEGKERVTKGERFVPSE